MITSDDGGKASTTYFLLEHRRLVVLATVALRRGCAKTRLFGGERETGLEARRDLPVVRFSFGASGGPDRLDERLHPEDGDHPLQVVGENVKAHLVPWKPPRLTRTSWWSEMDSNQRYLDPY